MPVDHILSITMAATSRCSGGRDAPISKRLSIRGHRKGTEVGHEIHREREVVSTGRRRRESVPAARKAGTTQSSPMKPSRAKVN